MLEESIIREGAHSILDEGRLGAFPGVVAIGAVRAAMSFDLFVHRFRNGAPAPYERRIAEEIFDRGALEPSRLTGVEYADGRGEIYGSGAEEPFDGFMLSHFGGTTICERVLEIADVTRSLIYWPSTHILCAVTDRATIEHLPADSTSDGSKIALVKTVDQLRAAINAEEGSDGGVEIAWPIGRAAS